MRNLLEFLRRRVWAWRRRRAKRDPGFYAYRRYKLFWKLRKLYQVPGVSSDAARVDYLERKLEQLQRASRNGPRGWVHDYLKNYP